MGNPSAAFTMSILPQLPLFIAYVVGVAFAASYARSLQRAALMAGIGFGLLALAWVVGAASQYYAMTMMRGVRSASLGMTLAGFMLLRELASVAGVVFLLLAIFARRTPEA
ncbi:MAG TPA: hypothetical protein VFI80_10515 [Burkholderiales bacterium]|nr:hypothetical protein [Burkholderiales bacterium]